MDSFRKICTTSLKYLRRTRISAWGRWGVYLWKPVIPLCRYMTLWALLERTEKADFWKFATKWSLQSSISSSSFISRSAPYRTRVLLLPTLRFSLPQFSAIQLRAKGTSILLWQSSVDSTVVPSGQLTCTEICLQDAGVYSGNKFFRAVVGQP